MYICTCIPLCTMFLLHRLECIVGRNQCNATYSYRHHLSLTNISSLFAVSCMQAMYIHVQLGNCSKWITVVALFIRTAKNCFFTIVFMLNRKQNSCPRVMFQCIRAIFRVVWLPIFTKSLSMQYVVLTFYATHGTYGQQKRM